MRQADSRQTQAKSPAQTRPVLGRTVTAAHGRTCAGHREVASLRGITAAVYRMSGNCQASADQHAIREYHGLPSCGMYATSANSKNIGQEGQFLPNGQPAPR